MKRVLAALLAVAMVFTLAACGGGETPAGSSAPAASTGGGNDAPESSAPAPEPETSAPVSEAPEAGGSGGEGKTYAIIVKSTGNPYNEKEASGFEEAVKEVGATCIIKAPANPTAEDQIAMIEELIAQDVDGIAIAANDADALQAACKKAMDAGIAVVAVDSATNAESRQTFANQADTQKIGETLVEAAYDMCGGEGEFAILSATAQATNQNAWIAAMEETLKDPKYEKLTLVKTAYGDDLRDKSTSETEGLIQSYPDLKCIVAPTTVGIAAASKVVADQGKAEQIKVTGLGLPTEMAEYIESGVCPYMYLWNPIDLGYLTGHIVNEISNGNITGATGDTFKAGRLNDGAEYEVTEAADGGTEVLLGPPFKFDPDNIEEWKKIY